MSGLASGETRLERTRPYETPQTSSVFSKTEPVIDRAAPAREIPTLERGCAAPDVGLRGRRLVGRPRGQTSLKTSLHSAGRGLFRLGSSWGPLYLSGALPEVAAGPVGLSCQVLIGQPVLSGVVVKSRVVTVQGCTHKPV